MAPAVPSLIRDYQCGAGSELASEHRGSDTWPVSMLHVLGRKLRMYAGSTIMQGVMLGRGEVRAARAARCKLPVALRPGLSHESELRTKESTKEKSLNEGERQKK